MGRPRKTKQKERRGRGEGSIIWLPKRKKFQASLSIDGTRRYAYVDTEKEAEEVLKQWKKETEQGLKFDRQNFSVAEYIAYWLEIKRPTIKPSTYLMYMRKTKSLCGELGKVRLKDLTPDRIQRAVNTLHQSGKYAHSTLRVTLGAFSVALEDAVNWDLLLRNPAAKVKLPATDDEEEDTIEIITPEQVAHLLNTAYE